MSRTSVQTTQEILLSETNRNHPPIKPSARLLADDPRNDEDLRGHRRR